MPLRPAAAEFLGAKFNQVFEPNMPCSSLSLSLSPSSGRLADYVFLSPEYKGRCLAVLLLSPLFYWTR